MKNREHRFAGLLIVAAGALIMAGCASSKDKAKTATATPPGVATAQAEAEDSKLDQTAKKAGDIVSQPAKDVGVAPTEIPEILVTASADPYATAGLKRCSDIVTAIKALNEVIGPDFQPGNAYSENRAGKVAEAAGATVVNSLIPFRGLVRELTGAGPATRRLNAAIDAGFARRGFLRGMHRTRGCAAIK